LLAPDQSTGCRLSYRQLLTQVDAFANGLFEVPFKNPAIMVIWGKDCAETFVAQMGAVKAGLNVSLGEC
jgi:long-subunit acyl-CoA synthetase (AMP-forming)